MPDDAPLDSPTGMIKCPIIDQKLVINCHIYLPDTPKAVSAICYNGDYYSYVRLYANADAAQRGVDRMLNLGNTVILTQVRKGLVLWVLEPDARLARQQRR
ncbi:hypothetical protein [Trichothermofontia sp.]